VAIMTNSPITGTAAGVPFTALPPTAPGPAPLVVTWHMLDAPRTDAAFAAALPMTGVPAWRVHLGMPMCGARMVDGSMDAVIELAMHDVVLSYLAPFVHQAADEFPAALAALRTQLPVDDGPIHLLGGSLGGAVALQVLTDPPTPIAAAALINPAIRIRSVVSLVPTPEPYPWTPEADSAANHLDFVARAATITAPLLIISGALDHAILRTDAADLAAALDPAQVQLTEIPDLAHPLADEPGIVPAPQLPQAKAVDDALTEWFVRHLPPGSVAE
jgi:pimeloyl-ACP methyl ester carboxylesterase